MAKKYFLEGAEPKAHEEIHSLQMHLKHKEEELDHAKKTILAMESSKFWKLRVLWLNAKSLSSVQSSYSIIRLVFSKARRVTPLIRKLKNKLFRSLSPSLPVLSNYGKQALEPNFVNLPWKRPKGFKPNEGYFKVLLISHDASFTGAPTCVLTLLKALSKVPDFDCWVLLCSGGGMEEQFSDYAPTLNLSELNNITFHENLNQVLSCFRKYAQHGVSVCNTAAISHVNQVCAENNIPVLAWLHELPTSIDTYFGGKESLYRILRTSNKVFVGSQFIQRSLCTYYGIRDQHISILSYATEKVIPNEQTQYARQAVRQELGLPEDSLIVLGCGSIDMRKGVDLFVQVAKSVIALTQSKDVWFIWIGKAHNLIFYDWLNHDIQLTKLNHHFIFTGEKNNTSTYFAGADLFVLTSREDPFPVVNLEAMSYGLPVVAFEQAGGAPEIHDRECGISVPYLDIHAMSREVSLLLNNEDYRTKIGRNAKNRITESFTLAKLSDRFTEILKQNFGYFPSRPFKISVVVPNFNHTKYIARRLESILSQSFKPDEIIFLDDASSDDSLQKAQEIAAIASIPFRFLEGTVNTGSPFKQWVKGIELCTGDLIWIAEADDYCDSSFLEKLIPSFFDSDVVLAYAQSAPVGEDDQLFAPDYLFYTNDISPSRWKNSYVNEGIDEVRTILSIRNTIPNASAVVFRKPDQEKFTALSKQLTSFRFCGDYFFYASLLQHGKIAFISEVLNFHRRHSQTVTNGFEIQDRGVRELLQVKLSIFESASVESNQILRSLGHSIHEYYSVALRRGLERASFAENDGIKSTLSEIKKCSDRKYSNQHGLKILVVIGDAEIGGGQIAGIRLANALSKTHQVFLCNARPSKCNSDVAGLVDKRVILIEGSLETPSWLADNELITNHDNELSESHLRLKVVRDLARLYEINVIMSHIWWADRFSYQLNQDLKIPWFIRMHGCYEAILANPTWDSEFSQLVQPMLQSATGICYSTERNIEYLENLGIPLPVSQQFFNCFNKNDIRIPSEPIVSRSQGDFVFCLCSRAIPEKGWEESIQAVLTINEMKSELRGFKFARLVLIGDSHYAQILMLKYTSHEAIEFKKEMQYPTEAIAFCDVGLLPTRFVSESLPSSVVEYLACGKPVIATSNGSIPQMLSLNQRDAGLIIPFKPEQINQDKLIEAMLMYMSDEDLLNIHQKNSIYIFNELFASEKVVEKYMGFFQKFVRSL